MRKRPLVLVLAAMPVLAGCESPTAPNPFADVEGCYSLQSVNGNPLPAYLPGDTLRIVQGAMKVFPKVGILGIDYLDVLILQQFQIDLSLPGNMLVGGIVVLWC